MLSVGGNELPACYLMFGFGSCVVPAAAAYLGCAVTAKAEAPTWCYFKVCRVLLICTVLHSIVLRRITLVSVVILLMSLPRRGQSGSASCASYCAFVDGMFRNAVLCTRGTERFMVCCELEHDHVPLN